MSTFILDTKLHPCLQLATYVYFQPNLNSNGRVAMLEVLTECSLSLNLAGHSLLLLQKQFSLGKIFHIFKLLLYKTHLFLPASSTLAHRVWRDIWEKLTLTNNSR